MDCRVLRNQGGSVRNVSGEKELKKRGLKSDWIWNEEQGKADSEQEKRLSERIDGRYYAVRRPKRWHQKIVRILKEMIEEYRKEYDGFIEVCTAPFGASLAEDGNTWLMPDLCIILEKDKITKEGCCGAPEVVFEVVEPETQYMDYRIKLARYRMAGVREYWIVDRDWDHGYVYYFEDGDMDLAAFSGALKSRVCEGLVIDFSKLKRQK